MVQEIGITCLGSNAETISNAVTLVPNATVLVRACESPASTSATLSADQDVKADELDDERGVGQSGTDAVGIQLVSNAGPGQFAAFGISRRRSISDLVLGAVPFSDPKLTASSSTVFAGVPAGSADLLAGGPYEPYIAIANFSLRPAHVTVRLSTTSGTTSASSASKVIASEIVLQPRRATTLSLADVRGDPGLRNSFIVSSDAAPGDLAASVASNASDGGEVEMLGKDEQQSENMGAHPWSIAEGNESTLLLFNHTEQQQSAVVTVFGDKSMWRKRMKLGPFETLALSISDLIRNKIPDDQRKRLATDLVEGEIQWTMGQGRTITGRLLVSNKIGSMARNFSCQTYNVLCGVSVSPTSSTISVGGQAGFSLNFSSCTAYNYGDCFGSYGGSVSPFYGWNWGGGLSATCGGSYYCSVTGTSPGQTTVTGTVSANNCNLSSTANVTVTTTPTISSITPAKGLIGTTISGVTIAGAGFGTAPTVNAGTGVTVTYGSRNNTSITANFAIAANATAGNHAVTVTANGQTSSGMNFYVQVPSKMSQYTYGPLNVITNGNVVDYFGTIRLYNECGVYRNITYTLLDQSGGTIFGGNFTLIESFSNFSTTVSPNPGPPAAESSTQNTSIQVLADIQFFGFKAPSCPTSNEHEAFDQSFSVTIPPNGSTSFPLSTVNHIERGKYSGVNKVDVTVKTP